MTSRTGTFAAVDLGASSGRVMVGEVGPDRLDLTEVHRFANDPVRVPAGPGPGGSAPDGSGPGSLHWDLLRLWHETTLGLTEAARRFEVRGVAVDTWAVDYALLDATGALLGNPFHYRDTRVEGASDVVHRALSPAGLYARNGLQYLPFTTIYQLAAAAGSPQLAAARSLLLLPDLISHWLGAAPGTELTNASTTGLLDVRTRDWSPELLAAAGVPAGLLAPVRRPGVAIGTIRADLALATGLSPETEITTVGSHDTASAVVGVPADGDRFAYIACGTWGLVGVELDAPVLTEASRAANFTNEGGVDGRIRYLRNVMGLWLLQESLREWRRAGLRSDLAALLAGAAARPDGGPVIDVDDPVFLPPGDMPARVRAACQRAGLAVPVDEVAVVRCVLDSLAGAFARAVHQAAELSGHPVDAIHLVGGGALNELLCRLTARAAGLPVLAGPVEATALGNILVQARTAGTISGDLSDLRALVRRSQQIVRYDPGARSEMVS
jgi:rhamnulokinase